MKPTTLAEVRSRLHADDITGTEVDAEMVARSFLKQKMVSLDLFEMQPLFKEHGRIVYEASVRGRSNKTYFFYVILTPMEPVAINQRVIVRTGTQYRVSYEGNQGYFAPEGYSMYYHRMRAIDLGLLPEGEQVYGYAQAVAHANELKASGKFDKVNFVIVVETICSTSIPLQ